MMVHVVYASLSLKPRVYVIMAHFDFWKGVSRLGVPPRNPRTSFFMAAQNSWLVSPPDPLLSRTCTPAFTPAAL
jgi:hypothetical protein